eukprot:1189572-Prorocentrum_minimum.AAC.1
MAATGWGIHRPKKKKKQDGRGDPGSSRAEEKQRGGTRSVQTARQTDPRVLVAAGPKGREVGECGVTIAHRVRKGDGSPGCCVHPCRHRHRRTRKNKVIITPCAGGNSPSGVGNSPTEESFYHYLVAELATGFARSTDPDK